MRGMPGLIVLAPIVGLIVVASLYGAQEDDPLRRLAQHWMIRHPWASGVGITLTIWTVGSLLILAINAELQTAIMADDLAGDDPPDDPDAAAAD